MYLKKVVYDLYFSIFYFILALMKIVSQKGGDTSDGRIAATQLKRSFIRQPSDTRGSELAVYHNPGVRIHNAARNKAVCRLKTFHRVACHGIIYTVYHCFWQIFISV